MSVELFAAVHPFIGTLRRKIGMPSLIHTVRHVGYMIRESNALSGEPQK
jgi:DNA-binding response OmpR family regulator